MRRKTLLWFLIMTSPAVVGFILLTLVPMGISFYLSLTKYDIASPPVFVGLRNYIYLLRRDPAFWPAVTVTTVYSLATVPLTLAASMLVALLLNNPIRFRGTFRTIFFLPSLLPATASAIVWVYVFHPSYGLLNMLLASMGIAGPAWTQSPTWALPCLIIMGVWGFGGPMIIFLAGLQGVPRSLYEAAELDGAGAFQRFRHVTVPILSPVIFFNLVMGVIGAMKVFDQAFVFGNAANRFSPRLGGPGRSTLFYVLDLYQKAFNYFHLGLGSAMAWMLFAVIVGLTAANFALAKKWVHYD